MTSLQGGTDNAEWISPEEVTLDPKKLPNVPGFHIIIRPVSLREKTKGGIFLPEKFPLGAWCKVGDYVCYGKHTGQKFVYKGVKLLLVFDDQVIMTVEDPKTLDTTYNLSN